MSYMSHVNGRGNRRQARPRHSFYEQWGMEARKLVSTGNYRGDTGKLEDLYIVRPSARSKLMEVGITVGDLATCILVVAFVATMAYAIGPGMDRCIDVLGW